MLWPLWFAFVLISVDQRRSAVKMFFVVGTTLCVSVSVLAFVFGCSYVTLWSKEVFGRGSLSAFFSANQRQKGLLVILLRNDPCG